MKLWCSYGIAAAALFLSACGPDVEHAPSIGEAWAGPVNLNIRKEIDTKSQALAVLHHGDHVEILSQRRLWYRVRTDKGIEGWVDDRQLMDKPQMERLRKLAEETAGMPSQGKATTYDLLNVHAEPNRTSPSFVQLHEKEVFEVVAHRIMPRAAKQPKRTLIKPKPKATRPAKKAKKGAVPPPASPAAPVPPVDWIALSKERGVEAEENTPPVAQDDWTLVRTASGQSGWVLTSRVYMLVPDEVAQYAEGHRIIAYFSIGKVDDHGEMKDIWLWTTAESLGQDYDFDSYRVFNWSERRHRYETAYIQRRERGYLPVLAKQGEFSVCVEDKTGARVRKSYTMVGNMVRPAGVQPCEKRAEGDEIQTAGPLVVAPAPGPTGAQGIRARVSSQFRQWFGKSTKK